MALTIPTRGNNYLALIIGPDTRADLRAKNNEATNTIVELRRELAAMETDNRRLAADLATAEAHIDRLAIAWARAVRPVTAARKAASWLNDRGAYSRRIAAIFIARAAHR